MGFLNRSDVSGTAKTAQSQDPGVLLARARGGDQEARNGLIHKFVPFILKVTSSASGRYVRIGHDDEVSVALIAFNEAINSYDESKGVSFLSFSETVIRRRLIDHYRKESKAQKVIPMSSLASEQEDGESEEPLNRAEIKQASDNYQAHTEAQERKAEILQYSKLLNGYGITFAELVELSPKHEDARVRAIQVARLIAEREEYRQYLTAKGSLPLKAIEKEVDVSRKTLERQRKYIIAVSIIFMEKFEYLREYIQKS